MRKKLEQWRRLAQGERRLLVELGIVLPLIGAALRLAGLRRTYRLLQRSAAMPLGDADGAVITSAAARRVGALVAVAARQGPCSPGCLRQSLALWWLLRRRRLPAELRIGTGREQGKLSAHAWVELAGAVVGDRASIADDYAAYHDLDRRLSGRDATRPPTLQRG